MAFFNYFYSCGKQPVEPHAKVEFQELRQSRCSKVTGWLKTIAQLPITIPHMIYTICMLRREQDLQAGDKSLLPNRVIHRVVLSPFRSNYLVTSDRIASRVLSNYRSDQEGLFTITKKSSISQLLLPIINYLTNKRFKVDDFLFTSDGAVAQQHRAIIHDYLGPKRLDQRRVQIEMTNRKMLSYLLRRETNGEVIVTAKDLCGLYSTSVISSILIGNKIENFDDNAKITNAIRTVLNYRVIPFLRKLSEQEQKSFTSSLNIICAFFKTVKSEFLGHIAENKELDPLQKYGLYILLYLAGVETTSSVLEYALWQLGRHPDLQNELVKELGLGKSDLLDRVISESLRLHAPVRIGREFRADTKMTVRNKEGRNWSYTFNKGDELTIVPTLIAQNTESLENPDQFNPKRKVRVSSFRSFSWLPFGSGAHRCPGQWLALAEIKSMLTQLLMHYEVVSSSRSEVRQRQLFTLGLDRGIELNLINRRTISSEGEGAGGGGQKPQAARMAR
ncbi:MAG: hypothetical protein S4CHLAM20_11150 [Chlamydiia bacterium]|nr:hypothetical protein [Chlamydiia bacterium]